MPPATDAVTLAGAGRRYGDFWALRDVTLALPEASITAVVGPNGAGKTTLLNLLVGLLPASEGQLRVVGDEPNSGPEFLARVGFVAQDCPLYKEFTVADLLKFGASMNPTWDDDLARRRLLAADVPLNRKAGRLSGGQRAGSASPRSGEASAGPVARRAAGGPRPTRPTHFLEGPHRQRDGNRDDRDPVVAPDRLAGPRRDHLAVIRDGRLSLSGELDDLLAEHRWVSGPPDELAHLPAGVKVITDTRHERHSRLLVRSTGPLLNPNLTQSSVDLEELVLAYLEAAPLADIGAVS